MVHGCPSASGLICACAERHWRSCGLGLWLSVCLSDGILYLCQSLGLVLRCSSGLRLHNWCDSLTPPHLAWSDQGRPRSFSILIDPTHVPWLVWLGRIHCFKTRTGCHAFVSLFPVSPFIKYMAPNKTSPGTRPPPTPHRQLAIFCRYSATFVLSHPPPPPLPPPLDILFSLSSPSLPHLIRVPSSLVPPSPASHYPSSCLQPNA